MCLLVIGQVRFVTKITDIYKFQQSFLKIMVIFVLSEIFVYYYNKIVNTDRSILLLHE